MHQGPSIVHRLALDYLLNHVRQLLTEGKQRWIHTTNIVRFFFESESKGNLEILFVVVMPPVFLRLQNDEVDGLDCFVRVVGEPLDYEI